MVTVKHLRHKYQILLIPLTLWSGFEQAFISAGILQNSLIILGSRKTWNGMEWNGMERNIFYGR